MSEATLTMLVETTQIYESFDYFHVDQFLSKKQRELRLRVREYVEQVVKPNINPYWDRAEFPYEIAMGLRDLGIVGGIIRGHGSAGLDALEAGLVMYELARGDGSIATFFGVQSGLAMTSIGLLGNDDQRARWLPGLARLEKIGAFGLTEPLVGSNASAITTTATRDGNGYRLHGAKRWIGNASLSDVLIIWARDEDGKLGGFVVEGAKDGVEGLSITDLQGKMGKRALLNADVVLDGVYVPAENRLAKVSSVKDTYKVLMFGRNGIGWECAGTAVGAFEVALKYAKERQQFGKPIASFQLVQQKLVEMATEITTMQLMCFQATSLMATNQLDEGKVSMLKYHNAKKARYVTQLAREVLGGNGILIENQIARLMTDAEISYIYEGTNEINLLLIGRDLTGINAIQ